jgi:hypothetical protein
MQGDLEVFTVPIGPSEVGAQWYARARLAVNNLGLCVWGAGVKGMRYISLLSRVMEKTSEYTVAAVMEVTNRLDLTETDQLVFWTDVGTHFRSYRVLSTLPLRIAETHKVHCKINYGCENHMKKLVDGRFALQSAAKDKHALMHDIHSISDCVNLWTADFLDRKKYAPDIGDEDYIEYFPTPKSEITMYEFTSRGRAHIGIKVCHSWEFRLKDKRRVQLFGHPPNDCNVTAMIGICRMLPGRTDNHDVKFEPIVKPKGTEADADSDEDGIGDELDDVVGPVGERLKLHTKELDGWRVSYKLDQPEKMPYKSLRKKLQHKLKAHQSLMGNQYFRRKPIEERVLVSSKTYEKQRVRRLGVTRSIAKTRRHEIDKDKNPDYE